MMNERGFLRLNRKFFTDEMWNEPRTFSNCEAWLDLIQSARFEAAPRKMSVGGREVNLNRGEYPASVRFLARRWRWTERRVRTYLTKLKENGMLTIRKEGGLSVMRLTEYEVYNPLSAMQEHGAFDMVFDTINTLEFSELSGEVTQQRKKRAEKRTKKGKKTGKKTVFDTAFDTTNTLEFSELSGGVTQQVTQVRGEEIEKRIEKNEKTVFDTANDTLNTLEGNGINGGVTQQMTQQDEKNDENEKKKKKKESNKEIKKEEKETPSSTPSAHACTREDGDGGDEEGWWKELRGSVIFIEAMAMRLRRTADEVKGAIDDFQLENKAVGKVHRDYDDYRMHALSWLRSYGGIIKTNMNNGKQESGADWRSDSQEARKKRRDEEFARHIANKLAGCGM